MKEEYDFSKGRRDAVDPLPPGKTRITIRIDDDLLDWFRGQVNAMGGGNYQTLINHALREHDTVRILSILFDRLYVLRNQLVHGGATWNSDVNRDQVRDGASLLGCLLPIFVDLMMDNPQHEWPMPNYPVVD